MNYYDFKSKKKNAPKLNAKPIIITAVAALLIVAIALTLIFTLNWYFVDTPYDWVDFDEHIEVPKYMGVELSEKKIQEKLDEAKDGVLDLFTKKNPIEKGTSIEKGWNVTVSIIAKKGDKNSENISDASYTSYEFADIGNHETTENKEFFEKLEEHILEKCKKFDHSANATYDNLIPAFYYTYPADYKVDAVKGKEIMHVITVTLVTETDRPALTDDIFKNNVDKISDYLGLEVEFASIKEFEDYMRRQIEINLVWNTIADSSKVIKYPEDFIAEQEAHFDSYYESVMKQNNITSWKDLYGQLGTNETGYIAKRTEYAEGVVKEELILYYIIKAEKIRMSGDEYETRGEVLALEAGYESLEDYENALGEELVERTVHWEIVKEYLLANAVRVA